MKERHRYGVFVDDEGKVFVHDTAADDLLPQEFWHEGIADEACKYLNLAHARSQAQELLEGLEAAAERLNKISMAAANIKGQADTAASAIGALLSKATPTKG